MKNPLFLFMITAVMLLFVVTPIFAMGQDNTDITNPATIVAFLSELIILAAVWLSKKLIPSLNGTYTLILVGVLSAVLTWVTNAYGNPNVTWIGQFALGIASVFIHQFTLLINTKSLK